MLLMADGGKSKIRHKNMADGVAENDGCHGGQKKGMSNSKNSMLRKKKMGLLKVKRGVK